MIEIDAEAPNEFITTLDKSKIQPNLDENFSGDELFQEMNELFEENDKMMQEKPETQSEMYAVTNNSFVPAPSAYFPLLSLPSCLNNLPLIPENPTKTSLSSAIVPENQSNPLNLITFLSFLLNSSISALQQAQNPSQNSENAPFLGQNPESEHPLQTPENQFDITHSNLETSNPSSPMQKNVFSVFQNENRRNFDKNVKNDQNSVNFNTIPPTAIDFISSPNNPIGSGYPQKPQLGPSQVVPPQKGCENCPKDNFDDLFLSKNNSPDLISVPNVVAPSSIMTANPIQSTQILANSQSQLSTFKNPEEIRFDDFLARELAKMNEKAMENNAINLTNLIAKVGDGSLLGLNPSNTSNTNIPTQNNQEMSLAMAITKTLPPQNVEKTQQLIENSLFNLSLSIHKDGDPPISIPNNRGPLDGQSTSYRVQENLLERETASTSRSKINEKHGMSIENLADDMEKSIVKNQRTSNERANGEILSINAFRGRPPSDLGQPPCDFSRPPCKNASSIKCMAAASNMNFNQSINNLSNSDYHLQDSANLTQEIPVSSMSKLSQAVTFDPGILSNFNENPISYIENQFKLIQNNSNFDLSKQANNYSEMITDSAQVEHFSRSRNSKLSANSMRNDEKLQENLSKNKEINKKFVQNDPNKETHQESKNLDDVRQPLPHSERLKSPPDLELACPLPTITVMADPTQSINMRLINPQLNQMNAAQINQGNPPVNRGRRRGGRGRGWGPPNPGSTIPFRNFFHPIVNDSNNFRVRDNRNQGRFNVNSRFQPLNPLFSQFGNSIMSTSVSPSAFVPNFNMVQGPIELNNPMNSFVTVQNPMQNMVNCAQNFDPNFVTMNSNAQHFEPNFVTINPNDRNVNQNSQSLVLAQNLSLASQNAKMNSNIDPLNGGQTFFVNWEEFAEAKKQVEIVEKLQKDAVDRLKNPSDTANPTHFRRNTQMERDRAFLNKKYLNNPNQPRIYRELEEDQEENNIIGPSPEGPDFELLREFTDTHPQVRFSQPFVPIGPPITSVSNTLPSSIFVNPSVNPLLPSSINPFEINGQINQKVGQNVQEKTDPLNFKEWNALFNQFFPATSSNKNLFESLINPANAQNLANFFAATQSLIANPVSVPMAAGIKSNPISSISQLSNISQTNNNPSQRPSNNTIP